MSNFEHFEPEKGTTPLSPEVARWALFTAMRADITGRDKPTTPVTEADIAQAMDDFKRLEESRLAPSFNQADAEILRIKLENRDYTPPALPEVSPEEVTALMEILERTEKPETDD